MFPCGFHLSKKTKLLSKKTKLLSKKTKLLRIVGIAILCIFIVAIGEALVSILWILSERPCIGRYMQGLSFSSCLPQKRG